MAYTPDLSNAITMHPHPFPLHIYPSRSEERSASLARSARRSLSRDLHAPGTSSAVEPVPTTTSSLSHERHHREAPSDTGGDVEDRPAPPPRYTRDNDPFRLSRALKDRHELDAITANTSRKRDGCGPVRLTGDAQRARRIQKFYETQNRRIEQMLKPVEEHHAEARAEAGRDRVRFLVAVWGSFAANLVLAGLQVYAAVSSGSLSLFATMSDAIFDPLSNLTLILSNRAVQRVDPRRFPSGKARLETVGNVTFCFLMIAVSMILVAFSVQQLAQGSNAETHNFHLPSVVAVGVAFATKLSLFLYCWALKDRYSQVNILWQDHRNDLLVNAFGILTSVGGAKLRWFIDPAGAIILSVVISAVWLHTAFAEFMLLVGVNAPVEVQQLITYVCLTHSPEIQGIDTVRVYHSGPRLIAEVDVVMAADSSLMDTHDVAEELQFKLESLPDVERAYVHVDYETTHKPEHAVKKDL